MKNNEKKLVATSVALGTALAVGAITTANAHADTKPADSQAASQNTDVKQLVGQRQDEAEKAQQTYADANTALDAAKAKEGTSQTADQQAQVAVDDAQGKVNDAQKKNDAAQSDLKKATDAVNNAKAAEGEATPENIAKAQKDVADQNTAVANAKDAAKQAAQAVANQNTVISQDEASVKVAQDNQVDMQSKVKDAQSKVTDAEDALKGTGVTDAEKAQQAAQKAVNEDQQATNDAQSKLDQAKAQQAAAQKDLTAAQTAEANAQNNYNAKKTDSDKTAGDLASAKSAVQAAQSEVDKINGQLGNVSTITLPADYGSDMSAYVKDSSDENSQKITVLGEQSIKSNVFNDDPTDKNVTVDLLNLDDATRQKLSIYAAGLMNQVRNQLGMPALQVTPESVNYAESVANQYNSDNWNVVEKHGHDDAGLGVVSDKFGAGTMGENVAFDNYILTSRLYATIDGTRMPQGNMQNLYDLKHLIYCDLLMMLFRDADSGWGHAKTIVGYEDYGKEMTVGFSVDKYYNTHYNYAGVDNSNKFGADPYVIPTSDALTQQLATAQSNLQVKVGAETATQSANEKAQKATADAQTSLTAATNEVTAKQDAVNTATTEVTNATAQLTSAQDKQNDDQKLLDDANSKLVSFTKDSEAKTQALEQANQALQTAQANLTDATTKLSAAKQTLTDAKNKLADFQKTATDKQQAVTDAEGQLQAKKDGLARLQNAESKYQEALTNQQAKQSAFDTTAGELKDAQDTLAKAKLVKTQADNDLNQAKAAVDAATKEVAKAKAGLWNQAKIYGDQVKIKVITIYQGDTVPAPMIDNPFATENSSSQATIPAFSTFIVMPVKVGDTTQGVKVRTWDGNLPNGTTSRWIDFDQVEADTRVPGSYTEGVLVTFPDGSTTKVQATLNVKAKSVTDTPSTEVPGKDVPTTGTPSTEAPGKDVPTTGTPSTEVPGKGTPTTGTPSTEVPGKDTPTTGTPSTEVPGKDAPTTSTPSTEVPGKDAPTTSTPSTEVPGKDTPTTGTPGTELPGKGTSTTGTPSTEVPGKDTPTTGTPSTEVPGKDAPTTGTPSTEVPGKDTPTTSTPSTEVPGKDAPTTGTPSTEVPGTSTPNMESSTHGTSTKDILDDSLSGEAKTVNKQALNVNGNQASGVVAKNDQNYNVKDEMVQMPSTSSTGRRAPLLPQTGNNEGLALGVMGLLMTAFLGVFGLRKRG